MPADDPSPDQWTIDELAASTGVPSRTIREYQRLELLPPPQRQGRIGRYGVEHRARLSVIGRLQDRGYSLAAIGDLLGSWQQGRGLGSVLGVDADPAVLDEAPTVLTRGRLVELVPALADDALFLRAVVAGLVHVHDDALVVRSLAGFELISLAVEGGVPPAAAVDMLAGVQAGAALMAAAAIDTFANHLWPRREELDLPGLVSRARLLMAQTSASLVVHELGLALSTAAGSDETGELAVLVERIAVGRLRRLGQQDGAGSATPVGADRAP